jgi:hypothetical protein
MRLKYLSLVIAITILPILTYFFFVNQNSESKGKQQAITKGTPTKVTLNNKKECSDDLDCNTNNEWCLYNSCLKIQKIKTIIENGLKNYSNAEPKFTVSFPPNFDIAKINKGKEHESISLAETTNGVVIKGSEGFVEILWGSGFGGYCENWEKISIQGSDYPVCITKEKDGSKNWRGITKKFDGYSLVINGHANSGLSKNYGTILKIITNIKFEY